MGTKTFTNDLTTRQYELYDYLKEQEDFKNEREIMLETGLYGDVPDVDLHNSSGIRQLKKDIRALRLSGIIQTTIIHNTKKGVKIATKEEYQEFSMRRWKALTSLINEQKIQDKKAGLDGQYRFVFNTEKPIIEVFKEASV